MKKIIWILKEQIKREVELLTRYATTEEGEQSPLHFEHIGEIKQDIQDLRGAIAILKYFTVEELLDELLKRKN